MRLRLGRKAGVGARAAVSALETQSASHLRGADHAGDLRSVKDGIGPECPPGMIAHLAYRTEPGLR